MGYEFKFNRLASLCQSIRRNGKSIEQFTFNYNNKSFDCILDIDAEPFEMIIGLLNMNFAFTLYIKRGYITEMSYDDFYRLKNILNLNPNENHFSSFAFLNVIDKHIPQNSSPELVPIEKILPYRIQSMSNADREEGFVFCGWLPHKNRNNGHVTPKNMSKTEKLLGKNIRVYCEAHDISSKWSNKESEQVPLNYPWMV